ncbi:hypothetical protein L917_03159, partial [Phytophthora nicotianae]
KQPLPRSEVDESRERERRLPLGSSGEICGPTEESGPVIV